VAQQDRHLTTEQLSAFLDGQLSPSERAQWDSHLQTCEQCQHEQADLRNTVNLMRALPQPALPRSFALPADAGFSAITPIAASPREQRAPASAPRRWPLYARNAVRVVSTLAAVLGLFFLLSGLIGTNGMGASTASNSSASAPSFAAQQHPSTTNSGGSASGSGAATPQAHTPDTQKQPASQPALPTPTQPEAGPLRNGTAMQPADRENFQPVNTPFIATYFDLSTGGGRAALGLLLLVVGLIGFGFMRLTRRWSRVP
jgi:anti-sigma factor RsiW